ncbi:MAG: acyltransferase [Hyphomonadaceae bacterium]|nr:acyltransferase [Hyphomonadaceae bacterium]
MSTGASFSAKRADIQLLRAWAVILVLLHHADLPIARAGYLGVDIFFVISGFLMTRLIADGIRERTFSFRTFYYRRAKRLLPASLAVVLICLVLSAFLMAPSFQAEFFQTALGAVTFTTNHVLASQSGYFDASAEVAPLLHYWSLAVEEQYYLVIPIVLFLCPARFWKWGALAATIASLLLCFAVVQKSPATAFYILPTRAWEMGIGSLIAIMFTGERSLCAARRAFWPAMFLLIAIPILGVGDALGLAHPGVESLIVCLATMAVLIADRAPAQTSGVFRFAGKIGDASYSLYLAHWPFFAFARMAWPGELPLEARLILLCCAIATGLLLHWLIERPIHRFRFSRPQLLTVPLISASTAIAAFAALSPALRSVDAIPTGLRSGNFGLSMACSGDLQSQQWNRECRSTQHPRVLVWGDSHAMHIAAGVAGAVEGGVIQATLPACPPTMGLSWFDANMSETDARKCVAFNRQVLQLIEDEPSIQIVVLAGAHHAYFLDDVRTYDEQRGLITVNVENVAKALERTVADIRRLGKRVVLVRSPPTADFDVGLCLERKQLGLPLIGPLARCDIPREMARQRAAEANEILAKVELRAGLSTIGFDDMLCDATRCRTTLGSQHLYLDNSHLSIGGGEVLIRELMIGERIEKAAS